MDQGLFKGGKMKRALVWLLGLMATLATSLAFANAIATTVNGSVVAQAGAGASRTLRQGDTVRAGETISTGTGASVVLRFDDGQIAALSQNSRMLVQTYDFNAQAKTGNVVLNLLSGGMRAITGLIGLGSPQKVAYKAGNYTIGIRGTDVTILSTENQTLLTVTVNEGRVSVTYGTPPVTIELAAGEGALFRNGVLVRLLAEQIAAELAQTEQGRALLQMMDGLNALALAITQASAGAAGVVTTTPTSSSFSQGGGGTASKK
jgi:hypothetical protein